jgi:hypothetical protein
MFDFFEFFAGGGMVRAGLGDANWRCRFANDFDPKKSAANELEEEVFVALVTLPPVTVAGMRAVIEYFVDFELDCIPDGPSKFLSALLQSPLLGEGLADV